MNAATQNAASLLAGVPDQGANATKPLGWRLDRRVTSQERVQFTSQLAMMTGAGVSVSAALKSIARQCRPGTLRNALEMIEDDVLGGSSLSNALKNHPAIFDATYVATVAAGEASGKMQGVLAQLAELQRSELKLQRTIRGMLIYPVLLTAVSTGVILTLVVFVLPRFATIFEQYEIALPAITQALITLAGELRNRWWLWGPVALAGVGFLVAARTTDRGRQVIDRALIRTPGLQKVTRTLIGARVCRLLGLLVSSGVPLLDCLHLLRNAIRNTLFQQLTDKLEDAVTNGRSLSEALEGNEVLPASAAEMIATAEKTGKLGEVSQMMGEHYDEEGQALARQMISVIEPFVTIVMGGVVALVVLAVMLPVFDIATLAQR
ncbi:Type II secretion system protein F [Planctomycetes bacterium MalM25]|nr:Type II secretion system protein F [Planctomycetes bacterium MalM25]